MSTPGKIARKVYLTLAEVSDYSKQLYSSSPRVAQRSPSSQIATPTSRGFSFLQRSFTPKGNALKAKRFDSPIKQSIRNRSQHNRPPRPMSKPPRDRRPQKSIETDVKSMCKPYDLNGLYNKSFDNNRTESPSRIDVVKGNFSEKQMNTPDRSPIKRGLSATNFEYSPEELMKNVANLNSNGVRVGRARTPKASNLSKGFKLDKSKLFSSFDRY